MRRVLLVTPAGSQRVGTYLTAARELGCAVVVATDARVAIAGSAVETGLEDPRSAATTVLDRLDGPVDAVVGTDGAAVGVAGEIARRCGLPTNSPAALSTAADKLHQRRACAAAGAPQPEFVVDDARIGATDVRRSGPGRATGSPTTGVGLLPAVVKPVDRSASQGVQRADTPAELRAAVARVRRLVGASAPVLIERFVPGTEVAVEALLRGGRLEVLAVFDKPDTPTGPTFPETLLVAPARLTAGVRARVLDVVERAVRAVGLTEGPVHAECKVDGERVWFLELAARTIGGLCGRSLRIAGTSLEELVLRHGLGDPRPAGAPAASAATGVAMLPVPAPGRLVAVHGVARARAVAGVTGVVTAIGSGETVVPLPDGDRYLGYVFARAATADDVERALRRAWAELDIEIADDGRRTGHAG